MSQLVNDTADRLGVSVQVLFLRAAQQCGKPLIHSEAYQFYLQRGVVPNWVHEFCTGVIAGLPAKGELKCRAS